MGAILGPLWTSQSISRYSAQEREGVVSLNALGLGRRPPLRGYRDQPLSSVLVTLRWRVRLREAEMCSQPLKRALGV